VLPRGKGVIQLTCPLDCVATLALTRTDGKVVWSRKAYALAGFAYRIPIGKLRLAPAQYAFSGSVAHPVNPGTPAFTQGGTFVVH
jgi:hypothetical protein